MADEYPPLMASSDSSETQFNRTRSDSSTSTSSTSDLELVRHHLGTAMESNALVTAAGASSSATIPPLEDVVLDLAYLDLSDIQLDDKLHDPKVFNPIRPKTSDDGKTVASHGNIYTSVNLVGNRLTAIPPTLLSASDSLRDHLRILDLSQNNFTYLGPEILQLRNLSTLIASNNRLNEYSLPKEFASHFAKTLKVLSLGGNQFNLIPPAILQLSQLRSLYLGSNQIADIPPTISALTNLRVLYLGGNQLETVPPEVGLLSNLQSLSLCENRISSLPGTLCQLRSLRSLALHRNQLTTLPREIIKLRGLIELSLRNNPLVVRFVRDMVYEPPSLLELSARTVKINKLGVFPTDLPPTLLSYLRCGQRCVNPKCKGVYFDSRVEHVKFVDFCGSYRLPLLQYLCSPQCSSGAGTSGALRTTSGSESESDAYSDLEASRIRRVLLG